MKHWMPALKLLLVFTVLTGLLYPLGITFISSFIYKSKADGSILFKDGKPIGSILISQKFENPKYFWPRPSSVDFNPIPSGATNFGPTSADLKKQVDDRKTKWLAAHSKGPNDPIPQDLITASGSGLDPDISPEAAYFQAARIANARQMGPAGEAKLTALIDSLTNKRDFGVLGEPRVNVLTLNLALDQK